MRNRWTRESILRQIIDRRAGGRPLTVGGAGVGPSLYGAARRAFGSWRNALQAAGVAPQEILTWERWSPAKILVLIRHLAKRDRPLTTKQMDRRYHNVVTAARRHYGSWNKAIVAAGVEPARLLRVVPWNPQRVLEAILTRALRNDPMVASQVEPRSLINAAQRFFGGWTEAVVKAGLDVACTNESNSMPRVKPAKVRRKPARHWNRDRVIEALRSRIEAGLPMERAVLERDAGPLYRAARRYVGGWHAALTAAGVDPQQHRARPHRPSLPGREGKATSQRSLSVRPAEGPPEPVIED